ncbi:hypothetical protein HS048_34690 [Planomonospora sp. ID91781]|uniref:hypothetical protein n=1 Tax=Planomonospora sp. ID91781 TaxID=2738135 RepID=UPI0018C3C14E|nr:hypothetical protein [Planomonospora sp. ID91781]MBG0825833.1 hypothetical protein [Planomonospora sp. ID91781]
MGIEVVKDRQISITAISNIVDDCETVEFASVDDLEPTILFSISQPDNEPNRLLLSVDNEVDIDIAQWGIEYAKDYLFAR